jgi:hypothetical protein
LQANLPQRRAICAEVRRPAQGVVRCESRITASGRSGPLRSPDKAAGTVGCSTCPPLESDETLLRRTGAAGRFGDGGDCERRGRLAVFRSVHRTRSDCRSVDARECRRAGMRRARVAGESASPWTQPCCALTSGSPPAAGEPATVGCDRIRARGVGFPVACRQAPAQAGLNVWSSVWRIPAAFGVS